MLERPHDSPMNIARGLDNLAAFITNAGFAEAGQLVGMAALSAWDQIERASVVQYRRSQNMDDAPGESGSLAAPSDTQRGPDCRRQVRPRRGPQRPRP